MFDKLNIERQLAQERESKYKQAILLFKAKKHLWAAERVEQKIYDRIAKEPTGETTNEICLHIDKNEIYSEEYIRNMCIKYRLRFLSSNLFKGKIPYEAICRIKEIEKKNKVQLEGFKIVAPAGCFKQNNCKYSPMLFATLKNNQCYLIHKWGGNFAWHRKITSVPLKNIGTLALTTTAVALLFTLFVPQAFVPAKYMDAITHAFLYKTIFFFVLNGLLFAISIIFGMAAKKNFSENVWNSKHFN